MDEGTRVVGFPRRDEDGRIIRLPDLLGTTLAGLVVGLLALVLLDGAFALLGMGQFGRTSGWLVVILPVWLFVEEFRAWGGQPRSGPARFAAAPVAAAVGIAAGLLAAGATPTAVPPLWMGALAGTVAVLAYALIWFLGVRWLDHRMG